MLSVAILKPLLFLLLHTLQFFEAQSPPVLTAVPDNLLVTAAHSLGLQLQPHGLSLWSPFSQPPQHPHE